VYFGQPFDPKSDLAALLDDVRKRMDEIAEQATALVSRHKEEKKPLPASVESGAELLEEWRGAVCKEVRQVQNIIGGFFDNVDVKEYLKWRAKTLEEPDR
jgi:hypothetical protein